MSTGDQYVWSGPASGSWGVAANWTDTTTGQNPAPNHPGAHDLVTIPAAARTHGVPQAQMINGSGASASLTIQGLANLNGAFRTGSLDIAGASLDGSLLYVSGGTLAVTRNVTVGDGGGLLYAQGGAIAIGGTVAANVNAVSGGSVQVGGLNETAVSLSADSTSWVEVGTVGGAQTGSAQIDAGATLHSVSVGAPTVVNHGTMEGGDVGANIVTNTGVISGATFRVDYAGNPNATLTVTNSGTITLIGNTIAGSVVNNGALVANQSSGQANVVGDVTGTGQIQMSAGSNLTTGQASSGQIITMAGVGDSLTISASSLDGSKAYDPTISGFVQDDAFVFEGAVTSVSYQAGTGTLSLMNGAAVVAQLHLSGNYSGDAFRTAGVNGGTAIFIDDRSDTTAAPPGTSGHDKYFWSSPGPGSWDNAANWTDTTAGANPAAVAPGTHDAVTINGRGPGLPQIVTGTGKSASLSINGDTVLAGAFTTKALTISGDAAIIASGGSLTVNGDASGVPLASGGTVKITGNLNGEAGATNGGTVQVAGTLTGSMYAVDGGTVRVGALADTGGGATVDATSSVEIGGKSSAAPGTFMVDAGTTVALYGVEAPTVVNRGTVNQPGEGEFFAANQVTNSGAITGATFIALSVDSSLSVTNTATGTITLKGDSIVGSLTNNGLLVAATGADSSWDQVGDISGKGQIQIGAGVTFVTGHASANQTIAFTANTGQLDVSYWSLDGYRTYQARIASFAPGDVIRYDGSAASVAYNASTGILSLKTGDGQANIANFHLVGDYSGDTFHLAEQSDGSSLITVTVGSSMSPHSVSTSMIGENAFVFPSTAGGGAASPGVSDVSSGLSGGVTDLAAQFDVTHPGASAEPYAMAGALLMPWMHHAAGDFTL